MRWVRRKPHKDVMNQLKMSLQQSIITLWQHGWSFRRIARELQLRRETVSKYVRRHEVEVSKPAKVLTGSDVKHFRLQKS